MSYDLRTKTDAQLQKAIDDCEATKNALDGLGVNTGLYALTLDVLRHEQERRRQAIRNEEIMNAAEMAAFARGLDL